MLEVAGHVGDVTGSLRRNGESLVCSYTVNRRAGDIKYLRFSERLLRDPVHGTGSATLHYINAPGASGALPPYVMKCEPETA